MSDPVVVVKQGKLRGSIDRDTDGNTYYKFCGIPYAKPPIGNLRFKAPQPASSWDGIRDATKNSDICCQMDLVKKEMSGSEDCLYLYVSTRHLPGTGITPKPVMVHIHGGAFTVGSGDESMFGSPKYLLTEDIVFVSINYRLGIFGFLSLNDSSLDVPGNAGLKDQTLALKWVQENISQFNGDPNNVTIFGISAGSASVHFHVVSPLSKGLFHKAICQSGSVLNPWCWGSRNAIEVVEKLGKKVSTEKEALEVLMSIPFEKVSEGQSKLLDNLLTSNIRRPFCPVIEKPNPTAFLTRNPYEILKSGDFNQVPIIMGATSNEGLLSKLFPQDFSIDFGVPWYASLTSDSEEYAKLKKKFVDFYLKDGVTKKAEYEVYSDAMFIGGIVESVKLMTKTSKNPIFYYQFALRTEYAQSFIPNMGIDCKDDTGAGHGFDAVYIFHNDKLKPDSIDLKITRKMTKLWTNFARNGVPVIDDSPTKWQRVTDLDDPECLIIDREFKFGGNPVKNRAKFWSEYFEKYPLDFQY